MTPTKAAVVSSKEWPIVIGLTWEEVEELRAGRVPSELLEAIDGIAFKLAQPLADWLRPHKETA